MALINYWSDINIICDRDMHLNALAVRGVVEAFGHTPPGEASTCRSRS
jgi:hypothetical protein